MSILLIGFMAAGKSSIAKLLDPDFIDTDKYIEQQIGMSTADYFDAHGEAAFRRLEEAALEELLTNPVKASGVIATGGGLIESEKNQELLLKEKKVIYLKADFASLVARLQADQTTRRSLFENSTLEEFRAIFDRRQAIYERLADFIIDTSQSSPEELAEKIRKEILD